MTTTKNPAAIALQALRKTKSGGPKRKCFCGTCRACKVYAKRHAAKLQSQADLPPVPEHQKI